MDYGLLGSAINTLSTITNDTCFTVEKQLLHTGTGAASYKYERNGSKIWETSNMEDKGMNNEVSITALMSSFGRAFYVENEDHPVFADHLAKELMTAEEYAAVQGYIRGGARFFEPEINPVKQAQKELLRRLVNVHIAPSPLCRAAYQ